MKRESFEKRLTAITDTWKECFREQHREMRWVRAVNAGLLVIAVIEGILVWIQAAHR